MASGSRLLSRIPPVIFKQLPPQQFFLSNHCFAPRILQNINGHQNRPFSLTAQLFKQASKNNAKPPSPRPLKPTPPPKGLTRSPPKTLPRALPIPEPEPVNNLDAWLESGRPKMNKVLLYVAPDHGGFTLSSYLIGFLFIAGSYSWAEMFLKERENQPTTPFWFKVLGSASVLGLVIFGTSFVIAPINMIKSITAVRTASLAHPPVTKRPWVLRFEIRPKLPFLKPNVLEAGQDRVVIDRHVHAYVVGRMLPYHTCVLESSAKLTEAYFMGRFTLKQGSLWTRFNAALLNIWPAVKQNVKRMFLRDNMAYVRVSGTGNFKMDLAGCVLLDRGRVLERLTTVDPNTSRGLPALFEKFFGGGKS